MTPRDRRAFLWDMSEAAREILSFLEGKSLDDYRGDSLLRPGVERQFAIIGEAAAQASRRFPELEGEIRDLRRIIAFRNRLVHGYAEVADDIVWAIAQDELPRLREDVARLLGDLD